MVESSEEFIGEFDHRGEVNLKLRNARDKINEIFNKMILVSIGILLQFDFLFHRFCAMIEIHKVFVGIGGKRVDVGMQVLFFAA